MEVLDGKLYMYDDVKGQVMEVLSVNDITTPDLFARIYYLASSDARNPAFKNYLVHPPASYYDQIEQLLRNRYDETLTQNNDHLSSEMTSKKTLFKGDVTVLVDNGTYSAATEFALLAKEYGDITVAGTETGGNCAQHNGDLTLKYQLPESGVSVEIPYMHIKHWQTSCADTFEGIQPDHRLLPTHFASKKNVIKQLAKSISKEKVN